MKIVITFFKNLARWDVKSFLLPSRVGKNYLRLSDFLKRKTKDWDKLSPAPMLSLHFGGNFSERVKNQIKGKLFVANSGNLVYSKIDLRNGAIGIVPEKYEKALFTTEFPIYEIDTKKVLSTYLQIYLQSAGFKKLINSIVSGSSGRKRVKPSDFENLLVYIPSLHSQKMIIGEWKVSIKKIKLIKEKIVDKQHSIDIFLLKELGINKVSHKINSNSFIVFFQDLIRWGIDFNRPDAIEARNLSSKKYICKKLFQIIKHTKGGKWGNLIASKNESMIKIIRATNFNKVNNLNFNNIAIRAIKNDEIKEFLLRKGEILIEKSGGGEKTPVGRVAFISSDLEYGYSNFLQKITLNNEVIPEYIFYVLSLYHSVGFTKYLQMNTTGLRNLIMEDFWKINIPVPSIKIQKEITSKVEKMRAKVKQLQDQADKISRDNKYQVEMMLKE